MNALLKIRVTTIGVMILFTAVLIYGGTRVYNLVHGVTLTVTGMPDDTTTHEAYLPLSGKAKNAVWLSINGRPLSITKDGDWADAIVLSKGYNRISVLARDKFDKETRKDYQIMLLN